MNTKRNNDITIATKKEHYPTSANGQQCIGPCYYSNTKIIHPITLEEISEVNHNFCPVNTFIYTNQRTGKSKLSNIDVCYVPTARETYMDDVMRDNVIAPQFNFTSEYFVKIYYKINNLEDLLKWLDENKNDPYRTKERVFDNSMVVYGEHLNIIDHRLVYFINSLMLAQLPRIYRHIKQYFLITNNMIKLTNQEDNSNNIHHTKEEISTIKNYIKDKFLGIDNSHQFMSKFIRYYKSELTERHISNKLVNHMIDYIIKRINITLEQGI